MNEIDLDTNQEVTDDEQQYTFEEVASLTAISVTLVERFANLNVIESENRLVRARDVIRIAQVIRLRRDLRLNWVGAAMVLDLAQENNQLRLRLQAYESYFANNARTNPERS